jgi:hypothetical protein
LNAPGFKPSNLIVCNFLLSHFDCFAFKFNSYRYKTAEKATPADADEVDEGGTMFRVVVKVGLYKLHYLHYLNSVDPQLEKAPGFKS